MTPQHTKGNRELHMTARTRVFWATSPKQNTSLSAGTQARVLVSAVLLICMFFSLASQRFLFFDGMEFAKISQSETSIYCNTGKYSLGKT